MISSKGTEINKIKEYFPSINKLLISLTQYQIVYN